MAEPDRVQAGLGAVPPSRRDRLRAATIVEIIQTARQLLVKDGPEAVSLRAIAREMGMTAPGALPVLRQPRGTAQARLRRASSPSWPATSTGPCAAALDAGRGRDAKMTVKMVAACREFRRWALNHKAEFGCCSALPLPSLTTAATTTWSTNARWQVRRDLLHAVLRAVAQGQPFPMPGGRRDRPRPARRSWPLPEAARRRPPARRGLTFLRCWVRLYGMVAWRCSATCSFALEDAAPMFEITLADLARLVGLRYPLPG